MNKNNMGGDKRQKSEPGIQVVEQTTICIQRTQSESRKRCRKLALPNADHLSSSENKCFSVRDCDKIATWI